MGGSEIIRRRRKRGCEEDDGNGNGIGRDWEP